MADQNTFKISGIPRIENIDGDDLLLVADCEDSKYYSRSMTIDQLVGKVVQQALQNQQMLNQISAVAAQAVQDAPISQMVMNTIQVSAETVLDLLDGVRDDQILIDTN